MSFFHTFYYRFVALSTISAATPRETTDSKSHTRHMTYHSTHARSPYPHVKVRAFSTLKIEILARFSAAIQNFRSARSSTFCFRHPSLSAAPRSASMKVGKPKSKRVPVRLRNKIEKASNAKQRKQRKEAKKNPQWKSRVKKDPGIPNLFPYKAKVLAEIEESKRRKEEEQMRRREVAKAQREGRAVAEVDGVVGDAEGDEILLDEEDEDVEEGMDLVEDGADAKNPMAALLASASARADAYTHDDEYNDDDDVDDEDDENEAWNGIPEGPSSNQPTGPPGPTVKGLPKPALADPVKTCTKLLQQMQQTTDGIQRMIDHYAMPPPVTAGSDLPTRFLVEVARKRGRLGRGGVPNLHSAALTVLGDVNEGRLVLPAVQPVAVEKKSVVREVGDGKGEVRVVEKMAQPFKIEGLWGGGNEDDGGLRVEEQMVVER